MQKQLFPKETTDNTEDNSPAVVELWGAANTSNILPAAMKADAEVV